MSNDLPPLSGPVDASGEPRACPLCGGKAYATRTVNGTQMFHVGCASCGLELKAAWYRGEDKPTKDILALWNTRTAAVPSPPAHRFDCPACGVRIAVDEDGCCRMCGADAIVQDGSTIPSSPVADSPTPEICICAAVQLDNGVVLRGHRHDDCFQTALKYGYKERITQAKQGFVTSRNRFIGREEGAALQRAAGIVSEHTGQFTDLLFSEDLYFNDNAASAPSPSAGAAKE